MESEVSKLKLMGKNYKIKMKSDLVSDHGQELLGNINYDNQEILLNKDASRHLQEQTMIHEIVHGIFHYGGISKCIKIDGLEEGIAEAISNEFDNLGVGKFLGDKYL